MGQNGSRSNSTQAARSSTTSVEQMAPGPDGQAACEPPPGASNKRRYRLTVRAGGKLKALQQRKRGGQRGSGRSGVARKNSRRRREMTALVRSWHVVANDLEALGTALFDKVTATWPDMLRTIVGLPEHAPVTRLQLLSHPRSRQHARRVMETVGMVVDSYSEFDRVRPLLVMLGRHHAKYGVNQKQLMVVGHAFLSLMRERLGDAWGPNLHEAWSNLFALIYESLVVGIEQRRSVDTVDLSSEFACAQRSLSAENSCAISRRKSTKQIARRRTDDPGRSQVQAVRTETHLQSKLSRV